MPTLHLSDAVLAGLKARCEEAHPAEACGLLLGRLVPREGKGPKVVVTSLHPARNVGAGPEREYEVAPEDFVAADAAARDAGLEILGVYHSHPDGPDAPSDADLRGAQPGWHYVIVSVAKGAAGRPVRAASWRCWQIDGRELVEQSMCVC